MGHEDLLSAERRWRRRGLFGNQQQGRAPRFLLLLLVVGLAGMLFYLQKRAPLELPSLTDLRQLLLR